MRLRKETRGRLILRESDGLIPVCDDCVQGLRQERAPVSWPLGMLLLSGFLLLVQRWKLGGAALAWGVLGLVSSLRRPGSAQLQRRLRQQAQVYSSVPPSGFDEKDVEEVSLDRQLTIHYGEPRRLES